MKNLNTTLTQSYGDELSPKLSVNYVIPVDGEGNIITNNGEGGASNGLTDEQLRASALAVTGPLTNAQFTAVAGTASVAAWGGTGNSTLLAIQKAIYAQNVQIIELLTDIEMNTRAVAEPEA